MIKKIFTHLYFSLRESLGGLGLTRIKFLYSLNEWISRRLRRNHPEYAVVRGQTIYVDSVDSAGLTLGLVHEPESIDLIEAELQPGQTYLDIGANIGYLAVFAARKVGSTGKVYAFEPDPENVAVLRKNKEVNHHENIIIEDRAVSDQSGLMPFYLSAYNKGDHRLYSPQDSDRYEERGGVVYDQHTKGDPRKKIEVRVVTLDEYFKDYRDPIHFLKIDVQGYEAHSLKGGRSLLERQSMKLMLEFWPAGIRLAGGSPEDLLDLLENVGYSNWERYQEKGNERVKTSKEEILRFVKSSPNQSHQLFLKKN